jgi:extracellular factor (EF) 3-hydroxypalmitic acid methyl ester biosynthesis protein
MSLQDFLDTARRNIYDGEANDAMEYLVRGLYDIRSSAPRQTWREVCSECRRHPIFRDLCLDPLTARSFNKPRGYAGDAVMLDMIYRYPAGKTGAGQIGASIHEYTAGTGRSPRAVRYRLTFVAAMVDEHARHASGRGLRILSIAAGHLCEAELSDAFRSNGIDTWIALDQDQESLATCERGYGHTAVHPVKGSVNALLSGTISFDELDFVYAAGLFDYLPATTAAALARRMFDMLRPDGSLMVANFVSDHVDAGYMEAFMDWRLIYRTEHDMRQLLTFIRPERWDQSRVFSDPFGAVWYAVAARELGCAISECPSYATLVADSSRTFLGLA